MQRTSQQETAVSEQQTTRSLKDYIGLVLRGMAMGASDIVPGVSGGTMAFILGIYEELIDSLRMLGDPHFLQALFRFRIKEIFNILNWKFLVSVFSGILLAILILSRGLEWLLVNEPVLLWSFFFGLVLASVFVVARRIKKWQPGMVVVLIAGMVSAYLLVGAAPTHTPNTWWFYMLSGAVAICAMILPGISGAFILVLLGKYQHVLAAVNNRDVATVAFVAVGAVIGLVTFAQILNWLFKHYHDITVAALTGLMVGSLRKVWPWKVDIAWLTDDKGEFVLSHGERIVTAQQNIFPNVAANMNEFLTAVLLAVIGLGVVLLLERLAHQE